MERLMIDLDELVAASSCAARRATLSAGEIAG